MMAVAVDAEFAARDEAMRQVVEHEAARADSAVEALEAERRNRTLQKSAIADTL